MSAAWPSVALGEVLRQDTQYVHALEPRQYPKLSVRLYGRGVILDSSADGGTVKMQKHQFARPGQVILSEIWAKKGAIGIVPPEGDGALCTSHFFLFDINEAKAMPEFIAWLFRGNYFERQLNAEARGTTGYAAIRPKQFLATSIPLPPLDEQRRVVARIEELATKVGNARGVREQSLDGVKALTTSAAAYALDGLTRTAPRLAIRSFITIRGGGTPSKDAPHFWGGKIPWITPKDMKRRALSDAIDHITEIATEKSSAKLLAPGAVLVVVRGMILAHTFPAAVLQAPATVNQDMKALIPDARVLPEYLCSVLWAWNPRVLELVDRSGHDTRKLNTDKLLAFEIPVPSIQVQQRVIDRLDSLQAKVDCVKALQSETAAELDAMLPAILDKAFKGDL